MPRHSRREFVKYGVGGAAALALSSHSRPRVSAFDDPPPSPPTTPFIDPLPIPPTAGTVPAFSSTIWNDLIDPFQTRFYNLVAEEAIVQFHGELPLTRVWRYRDASVPSGQWPAIVVGPTFKSSIVPRHQQGTLVRFFNNLPANHIGFGRPELTIHLHGGHVPSLSDGFPDDTFFEGQRFDVLTRPGRSFDYFYPMTDINVGITGFGTNPNAPEISERPSTLWYHDHLLDFTGPNVYRGLAGFHLMFEDTSLLGETALDTGNEREDAGRFPNALRLPSGPFDIPLVLQDRRFSATGALVFDQFDFDGVLGDKWVVNGKVQPFLRVKRRKYRFRILNGASARFFQVFLTDGSGRHYPMTQIGRDSSLLAFPVQIESFMSSMSSRFEIVIDFADPRFDGLSALYLEDRIVQEDGRGPDGDFESPELTDPGVRMLEFILEERVDDPSRVPDTLRPCAPIAADVIRNAMRRRFEYERENSLWVVNEQLADLQNPMAEPPINQNEVWEFVNKSGGWWHPVHTHSEFTRVLTRNGETPALTERDGVAKLDAVVLGPNSEVDVFFCFRDYAGPWTNHCHNMEHEDHAMMLRFDTKSVVAGDSFFRGRTEGQ